MLKPIFNLLCAVASPLEVETVRIFVQGCLLRRVEAGEVRGQLELLRNAGVVQFSGGGYFLAERLEDRHTPINDMLTQFVQDHAK